MKTLFQQQIHEVILYRSRPSLRWYSLAWKILLGLFEVLAVTVLVAIFLQGVIEHGLSSFLPSAAAGITARILCLGLVPLVVTLWAAEDIASDLTAEYVLTDRRLWVKGSPYFWSQSETPLADIQAMLVRREAVFIRLKSMKKVQVHMLPDGKDLVEAFERYESRPAAASQPGSDR